MKLDSLGNIVWQRVLDGNRSLNTNRSVRRILPHAAGYIILADSTIFQLDTNGNFTSSPVVPRFVSGSREAGFLLDLQRSGDGYVATGSVKRPISNFSSDLWLLKLDLAFNSPDASCVMNRVPAFPAILPIAARSIAPEHIRSRKIQLTPQTSDYSGRDFQPIATTCP